MSADCQFFEELLSLSRLQHDITATTTTANTTTSVVAMVCDVCA